MIDVDTKRMMENWIRWKLGGGGPGNPSVTSNYDLEARGRREQISTPLLNGEAIDVDAAVDKLPAQLKNVIVQYWLRRGSARQKAKACRCAPDTFYRRLAQAHDAIREHLKALRRRGERVRAALDRPRAIVEEPS
jgi:DNA-directed RNA polymerase specialized sigma24 family protein